jgi:hypothetical protein
LLDGCIFSFFDFPRIFESAARRKDAPESRTTTGDDGRQVRGIIMLKEENRCGIAWI